MVQAKEEMKALNNYCVLLIGRGYSGIAAAMKVKDQCNLTPMDARDPFHHNMGVQRSSAESCKIFCILEVESVLNIPGKLVCLSALIHPFSFLVKAIILSPRSKNSEMP